MSHASFWLDPTIYNNLVTQFNAGTPETDLSPEFLVQMSTIRRSIANFVRIVTGENIPVEFYRGKQSFATGDDRIFISRMDDPQKIDAMVGIACHEAVHIILSNVRPSNAHKESIPLFEVIRLMKKHLNRFLTPEIDVQSARLNLTSDQVYDDVLMAINVLEDRRIDSWFYERAVGYRGYYDAMYKLYWQSAEVDDMLVDPKYRQPVLESYRLHFINCVNPNADPDALVGLREIYDLIDLQNIRRFADDSKWTTWQQSFIAPRFDVHDLPDMIATALRIVEIMYRHAQDESTASETEHESAATESTTDDAAESSSDADASISGGTGDAAPDPRSRPKGLQRQLDMLKGEVEKDELTDDSAEQIDALDKSQGQVKTVGASLQKRIPILIYRKFTRGLIESNGFLHSVKHVYGATVYHPSLVAVDRGTRMGAALAHQLRVLPDASPLTYTREMSGQFDQSLLAELGFGNDHVFQRVEVEQRNPVSVHLTIDASSSMIDHRKWEHALSLAVALAKCSEKISTLSVSISLRAGQSMGLQGTGRLQHGTGVLTMIYDSTVDTFQKVKLFRYLKPAGSTPEGLTFEALHEYLQGTRDTTRRYLINISDGMPYFDYPLASSLRGTDLRYSGTVAIEHTAAQVRFMRSSGMTVLSYFLESGSSFHHGQPNATKTAFQRMYGKSAQFIDPSNVGQIARTLNGLFLTP